MNRAASQFYWLVSTCFFFQSSISMLVSFNVVESLNRLNSPLFRNLSKVFMRRHKSCIHTSISAVKISCVLTATGSVSSNETKRPSMKPFEPTYPNYARIILNVILNVWNIYIKERQETPISVFRRSANKSLCFVTICRDI